MVWLIAAAVLETFVLTNKDGALHPRTCWLSFLQTEGICTNYVDIEQKIMQVRFFISLRI